MKRVSPHPKRWRRGHIGRFWNINEIRQLPYVKQPVSDEEITTWQSQGYDYIKSFTGSMYDSRNPMPEFVERLKTMLPFKNMTFTFYRMKTLEIMPTHSDHYNTYRKIFSAPYKDVRRVLIMLEDWKPGHYLEIDGEGVVNWIAGDYFVWENDVPHAASNIGIDDRYTLQITCTDLQSDTLWKRVHWFNLPDIPTKEDSNTKLFNERILPCINNNDGNPLFVYLINGKIEELEELKHKPDAINELNEKGVDIYLYEPICGRKLDEEHNFVFYTEFKGNENALDNRADEFDSIVKYIENNKLTNVRVRTCDYNADINYPYYKDKFKLITDDLFVKTCNDTTVKNPELFHDNFTTKFINLNWRYTHHRHYLAAYLKNCNSKVSWYYRADLSVAKAKWTDYFLWPNDIFMKIIKGIDILNQNAPCNVDLNIEEAVNLFNEQQKIKLPANNNIFNVAGTDVQENLETYYRDIFCDVVSESRFAQPTGNYSEKVYAPMFFKKPFILAAPPYTLKYLREEGFKTFNEFWDESYDEIENHEQRLFAIFKVIDDIENKSLDELKELYNKMKPILWHNYQLLKTKIFPEIVKP